MPARRPPAAARDGSGRRAARRGEAGGVGVGAARPHTPRPRLAALKAPHATHDQRGPQHRTGDAGPGPVRDPPPTRWGEARAAVGRESIARGPRHTERRSPLGNQELAKLTRADEGRRLGGAVPQGTLFGSLEKAFSPRGASPPARDTSPLGSARALGRRRRLGGGGLRYGYREPDDGLREQRAFGRVHSAHNDTRAKTAVVHREA